MRPHAFVRTDPAALDDLAERLARVRSVPHPGLDRPLGVDPALLGALLDRWRDGFDWRAAEDRIAAYP
jgi:hypothetical protein